MPWFAGAASTCPSSSTLLPLSPSSLSFSRYAAGVGVLKGGCRPSNLNADLAFRWVFAACGRRCRQLVGRSTRTGCLPGRERGQGHRWLRGRTWIQACCHGEGVLVGRIASPDLPTSAFVVGWAGCWRVDLVGSGCLSGQVHSPPSCYARGCAQGWGVLGTLLLYRPLWLLLRQFGRRPVDRVSAESPLSFGSMGYTPRLLGYCRMLCIDSPPIT